MIAALHLDGWVEVARRFFNYLVIPESELQPAEEDPQTNYKSVLQERAHAMKLPLPTYVTVDEGGPAHARVYQVEARIGSHRAGVGVGTSKKAAAQDAARKILEGMGSETPSPVTADEQ